MKLPQDGPHGPFSEWTNFSVTIGKPGLLETLAVNPAPRRPPGPGEVEIEVHSVALNFKEVLQALGMLPLPEGGPAFGLECAGIICEVGPDVAELTPGMEVIAIGGPCLSALVTVSASAVVRKPAHLAWEQAAGIGVPFLTAYYSLHRLARLSKGESVLIHAAAGGVGLAAIQVAQWLGARIFATVGSARKREYLQRLGLQHIYNSRTLAFADEILEETGQNGVDVVLNSLSGEFIPKGLSVLAPFGRFLEIGRRDVYANSPLPLGLLEKGAGFFVVDLSSNTPGFQEMFSEVLHLLEEGAFRSLPCQFFSLRRLDEAFDLLARAQHIGKVVINLPRRNAAASADSLPAISSFSASLDLTPNRPILAEGLLNSEGVDVFRRVLAGNAAQVIVSTRSLDARIGEKDTLELPQLEGEFESPSRPGHGRANSNKSYVPPRNDLEGLICGIWEKFFRIKLIGIHDNFFDIGGDSLLAVQLTARMADTLGIELAPHSLLASPTIAGLAETLTRAKVASAQSQTSALNLPRCLVRIKVGDPSQPLYLIHPAGGHVFNYLPLAHTLATPHEVYGVQAELLNSDQQPMNTMEEMGKHYSQEIRKLQPHGPYWIGGASFGGALAYEIAQRLIAAGHEIGLLFLIDTADPELLPTHELEDAHILAYLLHLSVNISDSLDDLKQLLPDEQLRYFFERAKKANKQFPTVSIEESKQIMHQTRINLNALARYRPRPFPGRLVFFEAMEAVEGEMDTRDTQWPRLAQRGSTVEYAPGNHITMNFMPHVQVMGAKLTELLMESLSQRSATGVTSSLQVEKR